jgi:hypothetical protein
MESWARVEDLPTQLVRAIEEVRTAQNRCREAGIDEESLTNALLSEAVEGLVPRFGTTRAAEMLSAIADLVQQSGTELALQ